MAERQFSLSNQKISDWLLDQLKGVVLSYIFGLILISAFYLILKAFPGRWWLIISIFWVFFSVIIAKLTPILIIPLFFKYKKLEDEVLRLRILNLAERMRIKILDVFEIDLSKKSLKGNAAFVGVGGTKRVLLADTLKDKYTHDEIEVILAHEFAHYKLKHILKLIFINSAVTILAFYVIFKTNPLVLKLFGLFSLSDYASLPIIFIYFVLFGIVTQPLEVFISRAFEKNADMLALKTTKAKEAFISMMDKLAAQNLADRKPHPLIKFYFFDHPPVDERINLARNAKLD
jgi:STE24 endopeptidase